MVPQPTAALLATLWACGPLPEPERREQRCLGSAIPRQFAAMEQLRAALAAWFDPEVVGGIETFESSGFGVPYPRMRLERHAPTPATVE
jgi:hypothetical protein